jgi:alanine dehydrogenase
VQGAMAEPVRQTYSDAVVLTDADVDSLISMGDAVEAVEQALLEEAFGRARTMCRTSLAWEGGRMQALGGQLDRRACAAVKSWVVTAGGAQPTLLLFSVEDGRVLAIMAAVQLGRIRTGAASAVATKYMARADARTLLIVGTGRQAMAQVAGVLCVRDIAEVLVAGRDRAKSADFARRVTEQFKISAAVVGSVRDGASRADVITTVTASLTPVLWADDVPPGTHVNAVGAIRPDAVEVDPALFAAADRVAVDSLEQAAYESGELQTAVSANGLTLDRLEALHQVVAEPRPRPHSDISVFKSLGLGLEDAAVAELAWRSSRRG